MDDRMTAQKLRNSILQMAVQGKLVPQDPNDEPASVLLERIRKEKEQLIKEGKIKKNKKESYIFRGADNLHYEQIGKEVRCIEDELPFEIPDSWEWKSWGDISFKIQYGFNAPAKQSGTIKMVRISDIQNNAVNWDTVPYCAIDDSLINDYLR
jgi:type I restriction enzyme S subunit